MIAAIELPHPGLISGVARCHLTDLPDYKAAHLQAGRLRRALDERPTQVSFSGAGETLSLLISRRIIWIASGTAACTGSLNPI